MHVVQVSGLTPRATGTIYSNCLWYTGELKRRNDNYVRQDREVRCSHNATQHQGRVSCARFAICITCFSWKRKHQLVGLVHYIDCTTVWFQSKCKHVYPKNIQCTAVHQYSAGTVYQHTTFIWLYHSNSIIDSSVAKVWRNVSGQYQFKTAEVTSDIAAAMFFGGIDLCVTRNAYAHTFWHTPSSHWRNTCRLY